jgi:hypothetical protein
VRRSSAGSSYVSRRPALFLLGREKAGVSMIFETFFYKLFNRKFIHLLKLIGQNKGGAIDCFSMGNTGFLSGL